MKSRTRKADKSYHHGNLREAILEEALRTIEKEGEGMLSIRELASRAGVSHAAVYRHFSAKRDILAGLAERGFVALRDRFDEAGNGGAIGKLRHLGESYVRFALERPGYFRAMFHPEMGTKADYPALLAASEAAFSRLLGAIEDGVREGRYGGAPAMELALTAWAAVHGLAHLLVDGQLATHVPVDEKERHTLVRSLVRLVERGFLTR